MASENVSPDQRATRVWSRGSYRDIAPTFLSMAAHLVEVAGVDETDRVLDVACGTGNVAVTAARRGATVTGLDLVPEMLDHARDNATIATVDDIAWREGTATDLPFETDGFDVTLSCVGHMFAEPADAAARELVRVTKPGGTIAFTCWRPTSVVPTMGRILAEYLPPRDDAPEPPFMWGDPDVVRDRLGGGVSRVTFETGTVLTPALSPAHYWEKATSESGLFITALEQISDSDRPQLHAEMLDAVEPFFDDSRNAVPMDYRLAIAVVG